MNGCNVLLNRAAHHATTRTRRARGRLAVVCAMALAVACAAALPQDAYAAPVTNEVMLVNAKTGKCATIAGGVSTASNVRTLQFQCDTDLSRRWTIRLKL